ncbi:MAG: hypothetical protein WA717_15030 [Methyloceanibacter sp.]
MARIVGYNVDKDNVVYVNLDQIVTIESAKGGSRIKFANGETLHVMTEAKVISEHAATNR